MSTFHEEMAKLQRLMGVPGVALTQDALVPAIPDWAKGHEDPDTRANNFEARSLGQQGRRKISRAQHNAFMAELRRRGERLVKDEVGTGTLTTPINPQPAPTPPSPHQPVVVPTLLKQPEPGVPTMPENEPEIPEGDNDLATAIQEYLSEATAGPTDEDIGSALQDEYRQDGESWSAYLRRIRSAGKAAGLLRDTGWTTPSSGGGNRRERGSNPNAAELREEWAVGFSNEQLARGMLPMSNARANEVVAQQERAVRTGRVRRSRQEAALSAYEAVRDRIDEAKANEVLREMERSCNHGNW